MAATHFTSLDDPRIAALINNGAIGVIPTDTVYGLVASALHPEAVRRLYTVKPRELAPGTMIGASVDDFAHVGFKKEQLALVAHYWPAPLSVVLDASGVDAVIRQKRTELPVRIPNTALLTSLLLATRPLMTTSANAPKQPTSTSIQMAVDYFGNEVDFYVDGGDLSGRPPSTIIGFDAQGKIAVHRQGAVIITL